ncbi:MAG TPA: L-threonylcarbamoyladenylate synthase [Phycisphaerales bacterium]|nr:L-threonylcarbamoyladenylate synthase [Phycisphaerales bacterium]HMP37850.1 L-threonylcarbamoyladenylate synthase [Phycisphaerales bacterium]
MPRIAPAADAAIMEAAARLRRGELVAFPTETVYGLGGSTLDAAAVDRLYAMKGRPADNPIIAHVHDVEAARRIVAFWDPRADCLVDRFWPGPLTLVLPKAAAVPDQATGGRTTVAVRCPSHPVARVLLRIFGGPISAPSANRSGRVSPTSAEHVAAEFAESESLLILDGGTCSVGIESTVLELSGGARPRLLRPGAVTAEMIEQLIGPIDRAVPEGQDASPGTRSSHYAPRTPTLLVARREMAEMLRVAVPRSAAIAFEELEVPVPHIAIRMPADAEQYAARLYAALRDADSANAERILVERPESRDALWEAVLDRLRRACAARR